MTDILTELGDYSNDPLAFVAFAFPWEEEGELAAFSGPEPWQRRVLKHIGEEVRKTVNRSEALQKAIQIAVASGHGVGKSALVAWIMLWAISTFEDTRGVVTANTETQLKTKTWAELGKWHRLFIGKEFFHLTATALFSTDANHERTWRIDMVPWSERNTEAFAGLHNKGKRIILIFDEGSAIPDVIYEVSEGALTDSDTQIIWCVFGNPTRNVGRFKDCFERLRGRWWTEQVDSRTVSITNKDQFERWIEDYGEDSDFVRVRVRGTFPRQGEMEFISAADVDEAMNSLRECISFPSDPLIIGVDVARYGSNESVIYFRKGRDARSIAPLRLRGLSTVQLAEKVAEVSRTYHVSAIFIDGGGVGGGVVDNVRALHLFCYDINFGSKPNNVGFITGADGERYANKRAEMWGTMRQWIKTGALPPDPDLRNQLVAPTYTFNLRNEILLEKKEDMMKRGVDSPDIADGLALTFALPVAAHVDAGGEGPRKPIVESEYDPFDEKRMYAA